jgi:hypothetical protein
MLGIYDGSTYCGLFVGGNAGSYDFSYLPSGSFWDSSLIPRMRLHICLLKEG